MGVVAPARACALAAVSEARRRGGRIRDLLRTSPALAGLPPRDRGLATRLAVGCVRASGLLDQTIDSHLLRGGHLEPRLRDALRVAAFEMLFLSTPAYVAVSQGVSLAATVSPRARGLANAVLRRVAEDDAPAIAAACARLAALSRSDARVPGRAALPAVDGPVGAGDGAAGGGLASDVALAAAVPSWLARATIESVGTDVACRLALSAFEAPAATVAINLAQPDGEAEAALAGSGLSAMPLPWPGAFRLDGMAGLAESGVVQSVRVLPADLAAQVVSWLVAPGEDSSLLEVGQGRATKTILMAGASRSMGARPAITSIDLEDFKVGVASERIACAGLSGQCSSLAFDARLLASARLPEPLSRAFGTVFVDAPCSGSGTLRRHPEIAWTLEEGAVAPGGTLPALQLDMLAAASARVAPGGLLFYSTCSNLASENEDVVSRFLESEAGGAFSLEPVDASGVVPTLDGSARALLSSMCTEGGFLRSAGVSEGNVLCDGHFLARLRRR